MSVAWRRQVGYSTGMLLCVMLLASKRRCFRWEKLEGVMYLQKLDRSNPAEDKKNGLELKPKPYDLFQSRTIKGLQSTTFSGSVQQDMKKK